MSISFCGVVCLLLTYQAFGLKNKRKRNIDNIIDTNPTIIEICVSDVESAIQASKGGANSIELCANRIEGGITPSIGMVEECVQALACNTQINVLIRPRPGDFSYTPREFDTVLRDIKAMRSVGAHGIVFGALTNTGCIDYRKMSIVRAYCHGLSLTFHRAFDVCSEDIETTLTKLLDIGCDRILTSGRESSAEIGIEVIERMKQIVGSKIKIVAGAGVSSKNASRILQRSGADGIHASKSVYKCIDTSMNNHEFSNKFSDMTKWDCVDATLVEELCNSINI